MADLTITVTLTASINGRRTTITETCTVEDVYDVGILGNEPSAQVGSIVHANDSTISFQQDSPSLVYMANTSTGIPAIADIRLDDGGDSDSMLFGLLPGQCIILHEHTNGAGIGKMNSTMQTTYNDAISLLVRHSAIFQGFPQYRILSANIAST